MSRQRLCLREWVLLSLEEMTAGTSNTSLVKISDPLCDEG